MGIPGGDDRITTGDKHIGNGNVTVDKSWLMDDSAPQIDTTGVTGH